MDPKLPDNGTQAKQNGTAPNVNPSTQALEAELRSAQAKAAKLRSKWQAAEKLAEALATKLNAQKQRDRLSAFIGRPVTLTKGQRTTRLPAGRTMILQEVRRTRACVEIDGVKWTLPLDFIQEGDPSREWICL